MADKIALCLFVGLFPFAGSLVFAMWLLAVTRGARSRSWPVVEGRVQSSWAETKSEDSDEGKVTVHRTHVRYAYTIGRTAFSSERLEFNVGGDYTTRSREAAQRIADSYHYGDGLLVHYNPKKPQQSVLKAGVVTDASFYWALVVGITYYGIGLGIGILAHDPLAWAVIIGASCLGAAIGLRQPKPHS